jgi:hypothetical protein
LCLDVSFSLLSSFSLSGEYSMLSADGVLQNNPLARADKMQVAWCAGIWERGGARNWHGSLYRQRLGSGDASNKTIGFASESYKLRVRMLLLLTKFEASG